MARVSIGLGLLCSSLAGLYMSCQPIDSENNVLNDSFRMALDADQKLEFQNIVKATGRVEVAAEEIGGLSNTGATTDTVAAAIRDYMKTSCTVDIKENLSLSGDRQSYIKITGPTCQIPTTYDVNYKEDLESGKYSLRAGYTIQEATLQTQNDVTAMDVTADGQSSLSETQSQRTGKWSGTIQSTSRGRITMTATLTEKSSSVQGQTSSTGARVIRFSFPQKNGVVSFAVEVRQDIRVERGTDKSRYTLNGIEISKQEYSTYLNDLGLIFL